MPKLKQPSLEAKRAIDQAVRDERLLWESRRLEHSARDVLSSPRHAKQIKKRNQAIKTLLRIQQELWNIDGQFFPLFKPLTAAVTEPIGRAISKLGAAEERDIQIEERLGTRAPHREAQCGVLVRTLLALIDQGESRAALVRYAIHDTGLLQIPVADGLTEDRLLERLKEGNKPARPRRKS